MKTLLAGLAKDGKVEPLHALVPDELARWQKAAEPVAAAWAQRVPNGPAILDGVPRRGRRRTERRLMAAAARREPQAWPARLEGYCAALARRVAVVGVAGMLVAVAADHRRYLPALFPDRADPRPRRGDAAHHGGGDQRQLPHRHRHAQPHHHRLPAQRSIGRRTRAVVEAIGGAMVLALMTCWRGASANTPSRLMERQDGDVDRQPAGGAVLVDGDRRWSLCAVMQAVCSVEPAHQGAAAGSRRRRRGIVYAGGDRVPARRPCSSMPR